MRLFPGAPILLSLPLWGRRYAGKVVGSEPFEYMIVRSVLPRDILGRLGAGTVLTAQVQMGGIRFRFHSEMLSRATRPAPLLFLAYPTTVERTVLRRTERVKVSLPGKLHGGFGDHDVVVLDLARTGCSFAARSNLNSPLRSAKPGDRVLLNCDLSFSGCGQDIMAPVILRRVEEHNGRITMGGQFVDLSDENAKLLAEYLTHMRAILGDEG